MAGIADFSALRASTTGTSIYYNTGMDLTRQQHMSTGVTITPTYLSDEQLTTMSSWTSHEVKLILNKKLLLL